MGRLNPAPRGRHVTAARTNTAEPRDAGAHHDSVVSALIGWGIAELRDLPWRATRDPWSILVSEVMLQQTSVARVLPKYGPFMERFPEPAALAAAPLGDALALWQGLGYPRRCRNLREAASRIVAVHGGAVPSDLTGLLALPGVGAYTARAVLAFAHGADVAVVDTNVSRVLSRLGGSAMTARQLQDSADALVPVAMGWEWNQMIMELGARICTARAPRCEVCPLRAHCVWCGEGDDPAPRSAGASRPQGRFEGSDRQARGRAMRSVSPAGVPRDVVVAAMGVDAGRAERLIEALVAEGLMVERGGLLATP